MNLKSIVEKGRNFTQDYISRAVSSPINTVKTITLTAIATMIIGCPGKTPTEPDNPPYFVSGTPTAQTTQTNIGNSHTVRGTAEDPDGDSINYKTLKDGTQVNNTNEYTFTIDKKGMTKIQIVAYNALSDTLTKNFSANNQSPVANDISTTMDEDTTKKIPESQLGSDPDGDDLDYNVTSTSAGVNAEFKNGQLEITGAENFFGDASVNYSVTDGEETDNGKVDVAVNGVDDAPTATNVTITPLEAFVGDTLWTSYDYNDVEGDLEGNTTINQYINNQQVGNGEMVLTDNLQAGDKIKTSVTPTDENGVTGTETYSNEITLQASLYRTISGQILEHWSQTPDEGVQIITSVGETFTDANGEYSVQASTDEEHILTLKDQRLESGFIIAAGQNDETYNHTLSNDTKENGIDRWLFKNYVLYSKSHYGEDLGRSPGPEDGQYVALTEESVPDTAWILGKTTLSDGTIYAVGFQTLEQINLLGKKINEDLEEATNGLFSEDNTVIAIADSNYIGTQFDYPNMIAIQNTQFNINNSDYTKQSFRIQASETGVGFNHANYEEDNVTIKGGAVTIRYNSSLTALSGIFNTEAYAMILGDVEVPDGYGSVLEDGGREIFPHDTRITNWTIMRGPGHWYPDFPKNFKVELRNQYNQD